MILFFILIRFCLCIFFLQFWHFTCFLLRFYVCTSVSFLYHPFQLINNIRWYLFIQILSYTLPHYSSSHLPFSSLFSAFEYNDYVRSVDGSAFKTIQVFELSSHLSPLLLYFSLPTCFPHFLRSFCLSIIQSFNLPNLVLTPSLPPSFLFQHPFLSL